MNNQNRIYYIVGGTIAVGLLLAFLVFAFSGGLDSPVTKLPSRVDSASSTKSHHVVIEKKIDSLSQHNVTPTKYTTLKSEISSGLNAGMYPNSIKSNLDNRLADAYSKAVIAKINNELSKNPINQNEVEIYLTHLNTIGLANNEVLNFRRILKEYNYWTVSVPSKVETFVKKSFANYNSDQYLSLKNELEGSSNISPNILSHPAVISSRKSSLARLQKYYNEYVQYQMAMSGFD